VQEPLIAESLPELYRQVLERVAALEQHDMRDAAADVRDRAIRIYSGSWTGSAVRRLRALRIHAERVAAGHDRPRSRGPVAVLIQRLTLVRSA
jgi:hypothetical protein